MNEMDKKAEAVVVGKNTMLTLGALLSLMPAIGTYYVTQHKVEAQVIAQARLEASVDLFKKEIKLEIESTKKEWLLEIKELNHSLSTMQSDVEVIKYRLNIYKNK
jgi:hypothetical protein